MIFFTLHKSCEHVSRPFCSVLCRLYGFLMRLVLCLLCLSNQKFLRNRWSTTRNITKHFVLVVFPIRREEKKIILNPTDRIFVAFSYIWRYFCIYVIIHIVNNMAFDETGIRFVIFLVFDSMCVLGVYIVWYIDSWMSNSFFL